MIFEDSIKVVNREYTADVFGTEWLLILEW